MTNITISSRHISIDLQHQNYTQIISAKQGDENSRTTLGNYCFSRIEKEQMRENFCQAISSPAPNLGIFGNNTMCNQV